MPGEPAGRQEEIPRPKAKRSVEAVREAAVIVRRRGRVLLRALARGRPLGRAVGLPAVSRPCRDTRPPCAANWSKTFGALTGVTIAPGRHLKTLTHGVTRFRITLDCYEAQYVRARMRRQDREHDGPVGECAEHAVRPNGDYC